MNPKINKLLHEIMDECAVKGFNFQYSGHGVNALYVYSYDRETETSHWFTDTPLYIDDSDVEYVVTRLGDLLVLVQYTNPNPHRNLGW